MAGGRSPIGGSFGRLQNYGAADRRRALNDALLFATARKHLLGLAVLTRNTSDFDLLHQLEPTCAVLFMSGIKRRACYFSNFNLGSQRPLQRMLADLSVPIDEPPIFLPSRMMPPSC